MDELLQEGVEILGETDWNEFAHQITGAIESVDWNNLVGNLSTNPGGTIQSLGIDTAAVEQVLSAAPIVVAFLMICTFVAFCVMCIVAFLVILFAIIGLILYILREYLLPAIALYRMASRAGHPRPWFAFVPFLQTYLEYTLPKREFHVFFIRANNRQRFIFAIIEMAAPVIGFAKTYINMIPYVGIFLGLILTVFLVAFGWRKMYDLIGTYASRKTALAVSVIGIFIPWVYTVALLVLMGREPEFGLNGYLNPSENTQNREAAEIA